MQRELKIKMHGVGWSSNVKNVVSISPVVMKWNNMRRDLGEKREYGVKKYRDRDVKYGDRRKREKGRNYVTMEGYGC